MGSTSFGLARRIGRSSYGILWATIGYLDSGRIQLP